MTFTHAPWLDPHMIVDLDTSVTEPQARWRWDMQAEIYIPHEADVWRWYAACHAQAEVLGWKVRGMVDDWQQLLNLMCRCPHCGRGGEVDVGIVPTRTMLDPARVPRLLMVDEEPRSAKLLLPTQRRPSRRGGEGGGRPPRTGRSG